MKNSWGKFGLFIGAALAMAGCASPRSFDPNEGGASYTDTSYSAYQSCLDALAPLGQAYSCSSNSAGGQSANNYYSGGGTSSNFRAAAVPVELAANDPYFAYVSSWSPEAQAAQRQAWLELAESVSNK